MANIQMALSALFKRIRRGEEFPDACGQVATKFGVDYDELREAYDDECFEAACERDAYGPAYEDTPSLESCDQYGTGEGRYHGVI